MMFVRLLAGGLLLAFLFSLFRFAMALRWEKVSREASRARAESEGRVVVAELPLPEGEVVFLVEDAEKFSWADHCLLKAGIAGVRLRLNGGILGEFCRDGVPLPSPAPPEEYEGRERWDVAVYDQSGRMDSIPCGTLREGVSREVAHTVFEAVRRAAAPVDAPGPRSGS
jgi:hypothetical protein